MKTYIDCIPCFISHSLNVAKMTARNDEEQREILRQILSIAASLDFDSSPPAMAKKIHAVIRKVTGIADPYANIKDESTSFALEMLPFLRHEVEKSEHPFETTVRLIIAGNIIDFGTDHNFNLNSVHQIIADSLKQQIDLAAVARLEKRMAEADNILFIADNCGEIVFDRLLIEPYSDKITMAVRGGPILNDATRREAEMSGLNEIVNVIDTGDSIPGVILDNCGDEFRHHYGKCDLVISKGQGNFETLHEIGKPAYFLFMSKCHVIASLLGSEMGSLNVIERNPEL